MRGIRLYCSEIPDSGATVRLSEEEAHHAARVLRLAPGAPVMLLNGRGQVARATIAGVENRRRQLDVHCRVKSVEQASPPALQVRLCVAPPRGKVMTRIVRHAVELGVARITPVLCRYSVERPGPGYVEKARREAIAAVKQSGNPFLPRLDPPAEFAEVLRDTAPPGVVGATPDGGEKGFPPGMLPASGAFAVWVGPEGGFAPDELDLLLDAGFAPVRIGAYVLRVDTAVVALLGWLMGPRV